MSRKNYEILNRLKCYINRHSQVAHPKCLDIIQNYLKALKYKFKRLNYKLLVYNYFISLNYFFYFHTLFLRKINTCFICESKRTYLPHI